MEAVRVDAPDRPAIVQALRDLADRIEGGQGKYAAAKLMAFHQVVEEPLPYVRCYEAPDPWPTRKIPCTGYALLLGEETTREWLTNLLQTECWNPVQKPKPTEPAFEPTTYSLSQLENNRYIARSLFSKKSTNYKP